MEHSEQVTRLMSILGSVRDLGSIFSGQMLTPEKFEGVGQRGTRRDVIHHAKLSAEILKLLMERSPNGSIWRSVANGVLTKLTDAISEYAAHIGHIEYLDDHGAVSEQLKLTRGAVSNVDGVNLIMSVNTALHLLERVTHAQ